MKRNIFQLLKPKFKTLKRCAVAMMSLLIFFSLGSGLRAFAVETAAIPSGSVFTLRNGLTGKYLNVYNGNNADGVNVIQWDQDGSIEQKFRFVYDVNEDAYRIYAMCSSNGTNRVLDVYRNNGLVNGCNVDIWAPNDDPAQLWTLQYSPHGHYFIKMKSNPNLVLTAVGSSNGTATGQGSTAAGNVCVKTNVSGLEQRWYLEEVSPSATIPDGIYNIQNNFSDLYLDAANGGLTSGTNVIQYTANNSYNQMWIVRHYQNGLYTIHPSYDDQLALSVFLQEDTLVTNGINVELSLMPTNQVPGAHMLWRIIQNANGTYRIVASGSYLHKVLVVQDASTASNANVIQYQYNGSLNDQWIFTPVSSASHPAALFSLFSSPGGLSPDPYSFTGHAFLSVKNIGTSNITVGPLTVAPNQEVTIGAWPSTHHDGIWYNLESAAINIDNEMAGRVSLTIPISNSQLSYLNNSHLSLEDYERWHLINANCVKFAKEVWNDIAPSSYNVSGVTPSGLVFEMNSSGVQQLKRPIKYNSTSGYVNEYGTFVSIPAYVIYSTEPDHELM